MKEPGTVTSLHEARKVRQQLLKRHRTNSTEQRIIDLENYCVTLLDIVMDQLEVTEQHAQVILKLQTRLGILAHRISMQPLDPAVSSASV